MKTIAKIVVAGIILIILIIGGCAAIVGGAMEEVEKESQENAISQKQFKNLEMGTPLKEVKNRFGKPEDTQRTEVEGMTMDCIYYPIKGGEMLDSYQLCFDNGELSSKSRY